MPKKLILILKDEDELGGGKYIAINWTKEWRNAKRETVGNMVKDMQLTLRPPKRLKCPGCNKIINRADLNNKKWKCVKCKLLFKIKVAKNGKLIIIPKK